LGGEVDSATLVRTLVSGGVDEIVAEALDDVDAGHVAAEELGMDDAGVWLQARRAEIVILHEQILTRFLLG
jgi:hypothetical protein